MPVLVAIVVAMTLSLVATVAADNGGVRDTKTFHVVLTGLAEAPENAHLNADRGFAVVTFDRSDEEVCWQVLRLRLSDGEALPFMGHIHVAPRNVPGGIVVHLFGTGDGGPAPTSYPTERVYVFIGIVTRTSNPDQYYVNLHNTTHTSGVVRGQLQGGHGG